MQPIQSSNLNDDLQQLLTKIKKLYEIKTFISDYEEAKKTFNVKANIVINEWSKYCKEEKIVLSIYERQPPVMETVDKEIEKNKALCFDLQNKE